MRDAFLKRWRGVLLVALGAAATIWLVLSGQLDLYIHPRYSAFTAVMAVIGAVAVLAALILPGAVETEDEHEHGHLGRAPRWRTAAAVAVSALVVAATAAALFLVPPAALSGAFASQRTVNSSIVAGDDEAISLTTSGDAAQFTVKDWAAVIQSGAADDFVRTARPSVVGFVVADPSGGDTFMVARYVVTCCAVDAQPVGVDVRFPGWERELAAGQWVSVAGRFVPGAHGSGWILDADVLEPVDEPAEPYVY